MVSLVTGALGFVGSYLVEHLAKLGHSIAEISRGGKNPIDLLDASAVRMPLAHRGPTGFFISPRRVCRACRGRIRRGPFGPTSMEH